DGAGAVIALRLEAAMPAAPDVGPRVNPVGGHDRPLHRERRIGRSGGGAVGQHPRRSGRGRRDRGRVGGGGAAGRPRAARRGPPRARAHAPPGEPPPRQHEPMPTAEIVGPQTVLLRRPTGLADGLALKEPAPPPRWIRPRYLVPPLPPRTDGGETRRFRARNP